jgi:predicted house-cleaning noncanonical NTP pyrophosphatase (MazG superfamily)
MFFRKKKEEKEEIRQSVSEFVRDRIYELVAQNQMAVKAGIFTVEEFQEMTDDFVNEAETFYDDMDIEEIIQERTENLMKRAARTHVIKVEL